MKVRITFTVDDLEADDLPESSKTPEMLVKTYFEILNDSLSGVYDMEDVVIEKVELL